MNSWIPPGIALSIALLFFAAIPAITYIDYYIFRNHKCTKCGEPPDKHTWLLATVLEVMMMFVGLTIGILTRLP